MIVIDGTLPAPQLKSLIAKVKKALSDYDLTGLQMPKFDRGKIGYEARALGGAFLPVYAHFAPDRDVFLKLINKVSKLVNQYCQLKLARLTQEPENGNDA